MAYYSSGHSYHANGQQNQPPPPVPPRPHVYRPMSYYAGDDKAFRESTGASETESTYSGQQYDEDPSRAPYPTGGSVAPGQYPVMSQRPVLPYPVGPHDPATTIQPTPNYQHQFSSQVPTYNPQEYVHTTPVTANSQFGQPSAYSNSPLGLFGQGGAIPQYNPALYQDNGTAHTVARTTGSSSSSPMSALRYQPQSASTASPPSLNPLYASSPQMTGHTVRPPSDITGYSSQGYLAYSPPSSRASGHPSSSSAPTYQERQSPNVAEATYGNLLTPHVSNQSFFNSPSPEIREETSPTMSPAYIPPPAHPPQSGYFHNSGSSPSSQGPEPPRHSPQLTNVQQRHPQSRLLPEIPPGATIQPDTVYTTGNSNDMDERTLDELAQEGLFNEIAAAISAGEGTSPVLTQSSRGTLRSRFSTGAQPSQSLSPHPGSSGAATPNGPRSNGYRLSAQSVMTANEDDFGYDSDAEAAAGLEAMRMAEAQETAERERLESAARAAQDDQGASEDEGSELHSPDVDYGESGVDMSSFDGGYYPQMRNAREPSDRGQKDSFDHPSRHHSGASTRSMLQATDNGEPARTSSNTSMGDLSFRSHSGRSRYSPAARVDYDGTGGLSEPTTLTRKLSFDEGDERPYTFDDMTPDDTSGEIPDFEYYPPTFSRPLPPPPEEDPLPLYDEFDVSQTLSPNMHMYPNAPDHYMQGTAIGSNVPRSISLMSHSSTPLLAPPIRAKTDAEERKRQSMIRGLFYGSESDYQTVTPPVPVATLGLDLPTLPAGRRFQPSKFTQRDFDKCMEPWALTSIVSWLRMLAEGETDLKQHGIVEALTALFSNKVPTMSVADTETLVSRVVSEMFEAGTLVQEEEWLKFGSGSLSGVLYQLTGQGCYSPKVHNYGLQGRCYAHHCQRTVKKMALRADGQRSKEDWVTFYKLKKADYEKFNKKEVERQYVLHEIVQTEDDYMVQLNVLQVLYREAIVSAPAPIIPPKRLKAFERDVFGKMDAVKKANEDYLLPQLKYRQQEQGPWISGFSDIFRDWIRKAKAAYIDYAAAYPNANFLMRQEDEKNVVFRSFLEGARNNPLSSRLGWETFLKAPITRLQRYTLLLQTVHKNMTQDSEEKSNLKTAIDEIKAVTVECDTRVFETSRKVDLSDISSRLILRPEMRNVELNLSHLGRQLIYRGDLQRIGTSRLTWLDIHAMLFDHYLVLAKTVLQGGPGSGKPEKYDVSKMPIPMDLLILESTNDDPVVKSKGITSVTTKAGTPVDTRSARNNSLQSTGPTSLTPVNSSSSTASVASSSSNKTMVATTNLEKDEKILYPFRVKHLGKEVYTLFASSATNRTEWCEKIKEAKTKHAASLFAQNAEPFRLRVIADSAFAYDTTTGGHKSIMTKGTPLSRAIDEVEVAYKHTGRPVPICRARVNCATTFVQSSGKQMIAVGSDYGVFISEMGNARGWSRAITSPRVTQISVLEEFNLFLLLSDKSLIAYHLDVVCPPGGRDPSPASSDDSNRKAPQKLSGAKDVGFFVTGRMKDRTLVFYKKREGLSSIFKILEPVLHKSSSASLGRPQSHRFSSFTSSLHRMGNTPRNGTTDFFREYDDFYIPVDCSSISLFNTSLSVSTSKGFEILNLDKKTPWSIPDLKPPHVATIASRLSGSEPLAMFRLSDTAHVSSAHQRNPSGSVDGTFGNFGGDMGMGASLTPSSSSANSEFLCVYTECAVYVNKHGDISRSVVMEFVGKAKAAALHGPYLLLFDQDFVEIRNAQNGRLKQVIAGRDVKLLDDGKGGSGFSGANSPALGLGAGLADVGANPRTIKIAMQHPEVERIQIVVELVLNEGRRE